MAALQIVYVIFASIEISKMLEIQHLNFKFDQSPMILKDVSFEVKSGEILTVLGESGSGKSTLLKLIYGLEDAVSGEILFEEKKVTGPKFNLVPGNSEMKFVPQEFDLLDFVTVSENAGKHLSNFDLPLKAEDVEKALEVVQMERFSKSFPWQLSGGQRQRISIARALAAKPKMLLLDEPYSHLDQPLKLVLRKKIWQWAKENHCTVILTTHDVQDALGFSDRIIILKNGQIVQNDFPEALRNRPKNEYVAGILGEHSVLNSQQMKELFQIEIPVEKRVIIYPEEIIEDESGAEFEVQDVRFQGRDYLVEAKKNEVSLKFYSKNKTENIRKLKIINFRTID